MRRWVRDPGYHMVHTSRLVGSSQLIRERRDVSSDYPAFPIKHQRPSLRLRSAPLELQITPEGEQFISHESHHAYQRREISPPYVQ
jgi:hypothetical protein